MYNWKNDLAALGKLCNRTFLIILVVFLPVGYPMLVYKATTEHTGLIQAGMATLGLVIFFARLCTRRSKLEWLKVFWNGGW